MTLQSKIQNNQPIILVGITLALIPITLWIMLTSFENDMNELKNQMQKEINEQRKIWESLSCSEKKEYLTGKDLSSSRLFFYNLNEQFYREYVLECD